MKYLNKIFLVVAVALLVLIIAKKNTDFKASVLKYVYTDNIKFADINTMYKKYFGNQIPFNLKKDVMVFDEKLTYQNKEKYEDGVCLEVGDNYSVPAINEGMVVYVGDKEGYGNTVIVAGTNGVDTWYSNIDSNLKIYDYIEKGSIVGTANKKIYLVFKKNDEILNYEDYI